jgi:hypothetical protein
MKRYCVTGWSARWKTWMPDSLEARSKASAKEKFIALNPSLKRIKVYELA